MTVRIAYIALVAMVLQREVLMDVSIFGVHPDLLLLVAVCVGIVVGVEVGAIVGFVIGLAADAFLATPFGLSALSYTAAASVAGLLAAGAREHPSVAFVLAPPAIVTGIISFVLGGHFAGDLNTGALRTAWIITVMVVLSAPVAPLLCHLLTGRRRHRRPTGIRGLSRA